MTGNIEIEERLELMSLVGKNKDNLESAKLLLENFKHICWHTIDCFNREFQEDLESQKITILEAPDEETITWVVHGGPKQRNVPFNYEFEGNDGLVWTLEADLNDVNGFYIGLSKEKNKKLTKEQKQGIKEYVADKNLDKNEYWYFWKYLSHNYDVPTIYLWDFVEPSCDTFDLINESARKSIIDSYVKIIKKELKKAF